MNDEPIKLRCACGAEASSRGMPGHLRSKAHAERMATLEEQGDLPKTQPTEDIDDFEPVDEADDDIDIDAAEKGAPGKTIARDTEEDTISDRVIRDIDTEGDRIVDAPDPYGADLDIPATGDVILGEGAVEGGPALSYQASKDTEAAGIRERHRRERTVNPDERPNEYDATIGDTQKVRDMVFDWAKDYRGFRHVFTYFYNRRNIILDFFDDKSPTSQREAADKARIIAERNRTHPADDQIGYAALVVGTPLRSADLMRLEAGQVISSVTDTVASSERIPAGRVIDMSAQALDNSDTPEEERAVG